MNGLSKTLLLSMISTSALAATPIANTVKPLNAGGVVEVSNVAGAITVTAWDRNEVSYSGSLGEDSELKVSGGADRLILEVETKNGKNGGGGWFNWGGWSGNGPKEPTTLTIQVPRSAGLDLSGVSASIDVRGVVSTQDIEAESVSGNVRVEAEAAEIDLSSVSGDIVFRGKANAAELGTVSGDVEVSDVTGNVTAESVSGDVLVRGAAITRFEGSTVSGNLELDGSLAANADLSMESVSGDLTLLLPADTSARVSGESFSGSVSADFPVNVQDEDGPGKTFSGTFGGGSARIDLESFSGDINLRRK